MNIMMIGSDQSLVGGRPLGDAVERHRRYGEAVDQLDIIVYSQRRQGLVEYRISDRVTGHPTNSLGRPFFYFDALRLAKRINRERRTDVVVAQDPFLFGLVAWRIKHRFGAKFQVNFHGDFWNNPEWRRERWFNDLLEPLMRFVVRRADAVRVMSADQQVRLAAAGIPLDRIHVISTPVELARFERIERPDLVERLRAEQGGAFTALMVGRDDAVKDFDTLFAAAVTVSRRFPDFHLRLVGNLDRDQASRDQRLYGVKVVANGRIDTADLPSYYHAADALILSSRSESFGKVLVEAGAAGKPVIATATAGAREIIIDGQNGLLTPVGDPVRLADSICRLIEHPEEAKAMGEAGRRMAIERYGKNHDKIIALWKELTNA